MDQNQVDLELAAMDEAFEKEHPELVNGTAFEGGQPAGAGDGDAKKVDTAGQTNDAKPDEGKPAGATPAADKPAEKAAEAPAEEQSDPHRSALRAARHAERRLRNENEELKKQVEALTKANPASAADTSTDLTDAELEALKLDFPAQYKLAVKQRELDARLAALPQAAQQPQPGFKPAEFYPEVQEVIDSVPALLALQHDPARQDQFEKALKYDASLAINPDWAERPIQERLNEAIRLATGGSSPTPTTPKTPALSAAEQSQRIVASAPNSAPRGISDFKGGANTNQHRSFESMSMAELDQAIDDIPNML